MQELQERRVGSPGLENSLASYSTIPVWEIPWTEEPGGLQSMNDLACTNSQK